MSSPYDAPDRRMLKSPPALATKSSTKSARFALREATAEAHEGLDRLYSRFDLSRASDYGAFLSAHAPAFVAAEQALDEAGAAEIVPGWRDRRRADALLQDIATLGLPPPKPATPPVFRSEAQILGGIYVLEGSRLGGAVLIRAVASGSPTAFLTPGNPADWRALTLLLDERLSSAAMLGEAVAAAEAVFAMFEQSARAQLEPTGLDL